MLALFESSAHPQYIPPRAASSISYSPSAVDRRGQQRPRRVIFQTPPRTLLEAPFGLRTKRPLSEVFMHSAAPECQPANQSLLVHLVIRPSVGFLLKFERAVQRGVSTTLLERFNPGGRPLVSIGGL